MADVVVAGAMAPYKAMASLAYIGLAPTELDAVIPVLERTKLLASFYPSPVQLVENAKAWQAAAAQGHEIGNNSFHGVSIGGNLHNWTLDMVQADLQETEGLIEELFPQKKGHSFAYPGPETTCLNNIEDQVETSYEPLITERFSASLGSETGLNSANRSTHRLRSFDLRDPDTAIHAAGDALDNGGWIIFRIDEGCGMDVHGRVSEWLAEQGNAILTAPVATIASRLSAVESVKR